MAESHTADYMYKGYARIMSSMLIFATVAVVFPSLITCQGETKWVHICANEVETVSCPVGFTFKMTGLYTAFRSQGCPGNLTDPVSDVADCYRVDGGQDYVIQDADSRCNLSRVCELDLGGALPFGCDTSTEGRSNFFAVSYLCHVDTRPTTSAPTTTAVDLPSTKKPTSPVVSTSTLTTVSPQQNNAGAIAGAIVGSVVGAVVVATLAACWYKRRRSAMEKGPETSPETEERHVYYNMTRQMPEAQTSGGQRGLRPDGETNTHAENTDTTLYSTLNNTVYENGVDFVPYEQLSITR